MARGTRLQQENQKKDDQLAAAKTAGTGGAAAAAGIGTAGRMLGGASGFAHGAGAKSIAPPLDRFAIAGDILLPASRSVIHILPPKRVSLIIPYGGQNARKSGEVIPR